MLNTKRLVDLFFSQRPPGMRVPLHSFPRAMEDLPPGAVLGLPVERGEDETLMTRDEAAVIFKTPHGERLQKRLVDYLENAVGEAYGDLECERVFRFLSQYSVEAYEYEFSPGMWRGSRLDRDQAGAVSRDLNIGAMISFCAETPGGDAAVMSKAGLTRKMGEYYFPITDATPPEDKLVVDFLNLVAELREQDVNMCMHCEAGKGRTGVMVACIRMALEGWSSEDAIHEAKNFGMWTPDQIAFIEGFQIELKAEFDARDAMRAGPLPELTKYALKVRPGSAIPKPGLLTKTIAEAAKQSAGVLAGKPGLG